MKKLIALFLIAAMFLLGAIPALGLAEDAALTLPEGEQLAGFAPGSDGAFWLTACRTDDPGPWQLSEGERLYRTDPDGGLRLVYVREDVDPSPGVYDGADITALADGGDGTAWLAVEEGYIAGDGMTILYTYDLLRVDADGEVLAETDLSALCPEDGMSLVSLTPYGGGGVLALLRGDNGDFLAALDASGNGLPAPALPGTGRTEALVLLTDGSIAGCRLDTDALGGDPTGVSLVLLAPGADSFTAAPLDDLSPAYITDAVAGDSGTVWLLHARTALYAYDRATGQLIEGPDLLDLGVEDLAGAICQDGTLYAAAYGDGYRSLSMLPVPTDGAGEPLVLASFYHFSGPEARLVAEYNRAHPEQPVQVRSYAEYDDPLTRFNNDIIAGDVPDMVYLWNMPYDALLKQGLLADLTDYIEADPDIRREDYVNSMWDAVTVDGGIYSIVSRFRVGACWGVEGGLTTEEFTMDRMEAEAAAGRTVFSFEGGESQEARSWLFQDLLLPNLGAFVDFDDVSCSFDSPEFIRLLETVKTMPLTGGDPLVAERGYLGQYFVMPGETLLGYPTAAGGTFLFQPDIELAITARARDPEACWAFLRSFLLGEIQEDTIMSDLPVRRDVRGLYTVETGGADSGADAVAAILDGPMTVYREASRASAVLDIVQEETAAFFAGSATAEDVAASLQSRVSLYLAEQN